MADEETVHEPDPVPAEVVEPEIVEGQDLIARQHGQLFTTAPVMVSSRLIIRSAPSSAAL